MTEIQLATPIILSLVSLVIGYGLGYRNGQVSGELRALKQQVAKRRRKTTKKIAEVAATGANIIAGN
ncbi:MAG: hypothetical protein CMJ59_11655 [Planctomycetaceae bacterium]|nr:hypothetical protein [Planctomycetaceae bacterium]